MKAPAGRQPPRGRARWGRMRNRLLATLLVSLVLPAAAQDVPLPRERPTPGAAAETPLVPLPRPRPDNEPAPDSPETTQEPAADGETHAAPEAEDVPAAPPRIYQSACPAALTGEVEARMLPPISEGQCGAASPLAVSAVLANGRMVPLSGEVTTSCGMASALPGWVASVDAYLAARENTRIESVLVGTSYMCRNVNNGADGNLSFHAFAEALDVVGFRLADGRTVTIEGGWADALSPEGRLLRFAHGSACAHFTTTLGPEANSLHGDHLHLDLGCHGKTCTARLCE